MIDTIYLLLITSGVVILGVLLYLRFVSLKMSRVVLDIIALNDRMSYDPVRFADEVGKYLKNLGIIDYSYSFSFLGMEYEKELTVNRHPLNKFIVGSDFHLFVAIVPKNSRGEHGYFYRLLVETMFLLLKTDIFVKIAKINETFSNISRLQSFMYHDMKNLAQFIQAMAFNVDKIGDNSDDEKRFLRSLKESAPAVSIKANRIISTLNMQGTQSHECTEVQLAQLIRSIVNIYNMDAEIDGDCEVFADRSALALIFDNLIKNVYDKSLEESLELSVLINQVSEKEVKVKVRDTGSFVDMPEKLFEPFFTTKSSGLGIGLFQVRQQISKFGGMIEARNSDVGVEFVITMPKNMNV